MEAYDAEVEDIAVRVATAFEERFNAEVKDVSRPELARRAGLTDWPGFDLLSLRPPTSDSPGPRAGDRGQGPQGVRSIELSDNEWAKACNLRSRYWLYVVFDCASAHPDLVRVCDPFGKLLARPHDSTAYTRELRRTSTQSRSKWQTHRVWRRMFMGEILGAAVISRDAEAEPRSGDRPRIGRYRVRPTQPDPKRLPPVKLKGLRLREVPVEGYRRCLT